MNKIQIGTIIILSAAVIGAPSLFAIEGGGVTKLENFKSLLSDKPNNVSTDQWLQDGNEMLTHVADLSEKARQALNAPYETNIKIESYEERPSYIKNDKQLDLWKKRIRLNVLTLNNTLQVMRHVYPHIAEEVSLKTLNDAINNIKKINLSLEISGFLLIKKVPAPILAKAFLLGSEKFRSLLLEKTDVANKMKMNLKLVDLPMEEPSSLIAKESQSLLQKTDHSDTVNEEMVSDIAKGLNYLYHSVQILELL